MGIRLTKDEDVIRSYDYGFRKQRGAGTINHNLTVTNKRVIHTQESDHFLQRDEYPVKGLRAVEVDYTVRRNVAMIILGIILCCTIIGLIVGIPLIIIGCKRKATVSLGIKVYPKAMGEVEFGIGAGNLNPQKAMKAQSKLWSNLTWRVFATIIGIMTLWFFGMGIFFLYKLRKTRPNNDGLQEFIVPTYVVTVSPDVARQMVNEITAALLAAQSNDVDAFPADSAWAYQY